MLNETHLEVGFYPDEFVSVSDVVDILVIQDFVFEIVSRKPGSTFDAEAIGVTAVWGNVVMLRNINMWKSSACAGFLRKVEDVQKSGRWFARITAIGSKLRKFWDKKIQSKICWNPCLAMDSWTYPRGTDWHEVFPNLGDLDGLTMREQKSRYEASAWGFFPFPGCGKYKLGPYRYLWFIPPNLRKFSHVFTCYDLDLGWATFFGSLFLL